MWIDILILGHLVRGPAHGYEIKQRVGSSIGWTTPLNNNVLYPALRRLEEMGAVESQLVPQQGAPARRVYRLTDGGLDALRGMVEDFPPEDALNDGEFNVRLAYFGLIDPAARVEILRTRAAAVHRLLDHLRRSRPEAEGSQLTYAPRLVDFLIEQQQRSVEFVEDLAREEEQRRDQQ
jgi:DNA-binding PadR family transcriptional regulator